MVHLVSIIEKFKDSISHEKAELEIENGTRRYAEYTTLQEGLNSLFGVIMATSGCPVLSKLKPMGLISSIWIWNMFFSTGSVGAVTPFMFGGLIGGSVRAFITMFNKKIANITAPQIVIKTE